MEKSYKMQQTVSTLILVLNDRAHTVWTVNDVLSRSMPLDLSRYILFY